MSEHKFRNCYGYVRYSDDSQSEGDSVRRQEENIKRMVERLNLDFIKNFDGDKGTSAFKGKNLMGDWKKLKDTIKKNDVIVVEDVDRICRQGPVELGIELKDIVVNKEAFVITANNGQIIDKTNWDDLNILLAGSVAKKESVKKVERISENKNEVRKKFQKGEYAVLGPRPWWIVNNKEKQKFEKDEEKTRIVNRIFDDYIKGKSVRQICKWLNDEKISTPRKINHYGEIVNGWGVSSVKKILKNKSVYGVVNISKFKSDGEDWILYPPIMNKEKFTLVKELLASRRTTNIGRNTKSGIINIFKGTILKCKNCNNNMPLCHDIKKNPQRNAYRFKCSGWNKNACNAHTIRMDEFELSFRVLMDRADVFVKFNDGDNDEQLTEEINKLYTLNGKLTECKNIQKRLTNIIENNPLDTLVNRLEELEKEEREINKLITNQESIVFKLQRPFERIMKVEYKTLNDKWNNNDYRPQLAELIRSCVSRVVVDKEKREYDVYFVKNMNPIHVKLEPRRKGNNQYQQNINNIGNGCWINETYMDYKKLGYGKY